MLVDREFGGPGRDPRRPLAPEPSETPITTDPKPLPIEGGPGPGPITSGPEYSQPKVASQGTEVMPFDSIGDIPPPPIPAPPKTTGAGVAGLRGTEAGTLSLPGTAGARPFRSAAFQPVRPRFGPGVPLAGGGSTDVSGLGDPDEVGELLRALAVGRVQ